MNLHPPILESRSLQWPDEAGCEATARALAARPALHDACLYLQGELGAGKTTFVRHLLRALGVKGRIKSPTYAVVEPYQLHLPDGQDLAVSHFDFYRFQDPREWEDAGFRELFAQRGLKLCEWPDRVAAVLPPPDLVLHLGLDDEAGRVARLDAHSPRGRDLLP